MSIIQEALNKAQVNLKQGVVMPDAGTARDRRISPLPARLAGKPIKPRLKKHEHTILIALVVFLSVLVFAVSLSYLLKRGKEDKNMFDPSIAQEVSYAPIIAGEAGSSAGVLRTTKPPDLYLSGIMYMEESPKAIINDRIIGPGDSVSGAKVKKIGPKNAVLEFKDTEITLSLK